MSTKAAKLPELAADSLLNSSTELISGDDKEGFGQSGEKKPTCSSSSSSSPSSSSSSEVKGELEVQPIATEARGSSTMTPPGQDPNTDEQDGSRLVQADVHASLENGEKDPPGSSSSSPEERGKDSDRRGEEEEEDEDGSRKEDYSEGDLVDISAYSGIGEEDSGGSQLDDEEDEEDEEEEEEEEDYQKESSCSEIQGLPEEEEPPPANRKIQFSVGPIKVSRMDFLLLGLC